MSVVRGGGIPGSTLLEFAQYAQLKHSFTFTIQHLLIVTMTERKYHRFPDTQPPIYQRTDVAMEPILGRMPLDTETLVQCKLLPSYSHIRYRISPWEGEGERPLSYESQMKIIQDHKDEVTVIAGENGTDDGSSQATSSDQRKRRRTLSGSKQTTKANSSSNTIAKTSTTTSSSSKAPTMTQSTTNSVARSSSSARQQPQQPPVSIATRSIATQTYDPEDFVEQSSPNTLDTLPTSYEPVCDLNSPPTTAPGTRIVATQTPFFPRQFYTIRPSDSFKVVMLYNSEDLLKPAYFFIEKHEIYDFPSSTIDNHDRIVLNYEMNRKAKTNITEWDLSGWDKCPLCRKSFLKKDVCIMAVERRIKMVPGYVSVQFSFFSEYGVVDLYQFFANLVFLSLNYRVWICVSCRLVGANLALLN